MSNIIKISTIFGWIAIIANWIAPFGGQLETILHWTGIALAIAHFIEIFIYIPLMKKAGGITANHVFQVFVFGVGHFLVLQALAKANDSNANATAA